TMSFAQPTNIHPAARLAVSGLGASCANGAAGGDHGWASEKPGSYGIDSGGEKDRRGHTFGGGGVGAGAR
ncbi:MAG TPA: hypothetical protein VEY93_08420, partial [Longimicrobium sp.]|nr:hypothetical protein [Longimicrobium sp.]